MADKKSYAVVAGRLSRVAGEDIQIIDILGGLFTLQNGHEHGNNSFSCHRSSKVSTLSWVFTETGTAITVATRTARVKTIEVRIPVQ